MFYWLDGHLGSLFGSVLSYAKESISGGWGKDKADLHLGSLQPRTNNNRNETLLERETPGEMVSKK